jgi:hypothetical protein
MASLDKSYSKFSKDDRTEIIRLKAKDFDPLYEDMQWSIEQIKSWDRTSRGNFIAWLTQTEHKITLLEDVEKKRLTDSLYPVLIKAQTFFILLFVTLLFIGLTYWYVVNRENVLLFNLTNTDEEPEPIAELDFAKLYITILLVLMVPIIKPLEEKDIQFESPFWTIGSGSFSKRNNPEDCNCKESNPP